MVLPSVATPCCRRFYSVRVAGLGKRGKSSNFSHTPQVVETDCSKGSGNWDGKGREIAVEVIAINL